MTITRHPQNPIALGGHVSIELGDGTSLRDVSEAREVLEAFGYRLTSYQAAGEVRFRVINDHTNEPVALETRHDYGRQVHATKRDSIDLRDIRRFIYSTGMLPDRRKGGDRRLP